MQSSVIVPVAQRDDEREQTDEENKPSRLAPMRSAIIGKAVNHPLRILAR